MEQLIDPEYETEVKAMLAAHQKLQEFCKALNRGFIIIDIRGGYIYHVGVRRDIYIDKKMDEID